MRPPNRDRIVHHALVNVLEPIFERTFIANSYACRKGKGTHAGVKRCQQFARRFRYVLKADVQKFFPSLDHEILKALVARKIKDKDVLWLAGQIIDHSNPQEEVVNMAMNLDFPASIPVAHGGRDHLRAQRSPINRLRPHRPE